MILQRPYILFQLNQSEKKNDSVDTVSICNKLSKLAFKLLILECRIEK